MEWPLGLQKPGLSDRGVANGVTKFRMASGGLMIIDNIKSNRLKIDKCFKGMQFAVFVHYKTICVYH